MRPSSLVRRLLARVASDPVDGNGTESRGEASSLSKEEYVRSALEEAGGSLKQKSIVDLRDWSKATVSRTLSEMESDGLIEREKRGREKVVYLREDPRDRRRSAFERFAE